MQILVISDSHGLQEELFQVFHRHDHEVDVMIHCGDSELPKKAFLPFHNLLIVRGNCDYDHEYKDEISKTVLGVTIFITHGHMHNVKTSAVNLSYRGEELGANIVCFGHTHVATAFQENGVLYINPGSLRLPKMRLERTYAIIKYENNFARVTYYDHLGNEIPDLKYGFSIV